jgi:hypothetical protein
VLTLHTLFCESCCHVLLPTGCERVSLQNVGRDVWHSWLNPRSNRPSIEHPLAGNLVELPVSQQAHVATNVADHFLHFNPATIASTPITVSRDKALTLVALVSLSLAELRICGISNCRYG